MWVALMLRWALLVLGLIYLVTESAILTAPRVWIARRGLLAAVFVYCASCTGFWIGCAVALWTWPFDMAPAWEHVLEGGVAAMALGALWSSWKGGNPAWIAEAPLHDNEEPETARESREEQVHDDA